MAGAAGAAQGRDRAADNLAAARTRSVIPWYHGGVAAAFAQAKAAGKPLFLYWGATWCPPCNQVKATIFSRQDFIEHARLFIPVYLDGDSPGAQKLAARFRVRGYPTMLLFNPDGMEITRLPGEIDAAQYLQVLRMGLNAARPVKALLASALGGASSGGAALADDDWRMLAFYSWDTDEQQLIAAQDLPATLMRLAQLCPAELPEISARLTFKALAFAATAKASLAGPDAADTDQVMSALGDPRISREIVDLLTNDAGPVVGFVTAPDSQQRAQMVAAWDAALDRLSGDDTLSAVDRLNALAARIALARLVSPALAESLLTEVRGAVARADRQASTPYTRQAVISAAADVLSEAGLLDESDRLLRAELQRSHAPYYFMLGLAENARKRGDNAAVIAWTSRAYAAARGPATRLQWGVRLVRTLIELTPQDEARIARAAQSVLGELQPAADAFYERNRTALEKLAEQLARWNRDNRHAAVLMRLHAQLDRLCHRLPADQPARATCSGVFKTAGVAQASS